MWGALFPSKCTLLGMGCRGCWVGERLCPFPLCFDLGLFVFSHWGRLSKQWMPRPQPRSGCTVTGGLRSWPPRMRLLFPALVLALLATTRAEGEPEPASPPPGASRLQPGWGWGVSVAPGLMEGVGSPGRVRRGSGGGHGRWLRWLRLTAWREGKQAARRYQWCLDKSLTILQLGCQRGAGTPAQPGPWLPSQRDVGRSRERCCCSPGDGVTHGEVGSPHLGCACICFHPWVWAGGKVLAPLPPPPITGPALTVGSCRLLLGPLR